MPAAVRSPETEVTCNILIRFANDTHRMIPRTRRHVARRPSRRSGWWSKCLAATLPNILLEVNTGRSAGVRVHRGDPQRTQHHLNRPDSGSRRNLRQNRAMIGGMVRTILRQQQN